MPTTGEQTTTTAVYSATCARGHTRRILLNRGEVFPPCGEATPAGICAAPVVWQIAKAADGS
jgi:hypothetical protein